MYEARKIMNLSNKFVCFPPKIVKKLINVFSCQNTKKLLSIDILIMEKQILSFFYTTRRKKIYKICSKVTPDVNFEIRFSTRVYNKRKNN